MASFVLFFHALVAFAAGAGPDNPMLCSTVVVGGGISGLYAAERLTALYPAETACLVEKLELGGRILDVRMDAVPGVVVGLGAWRLDANHERMWALAKRFRIKTEPWNFDKDILAEARGAWSADPNALKPQFPSLMSGRFKGMNQSQLFGILFSPPLSETGSDYADMDDFMKSNLSPEAQAWLLSNTPFSDMRRVDVAGFMEYLSYEAQDANDMHRPLGGMSSFTRALESALAARPNAHIFQNDEVLSVDRVSFEFEVRTAAHRFVAPRVVLAVPPAALSRMSGNVITNITSSPEISSILPQKAAKGASAYPYPWWETAPHPIKTMQRFISKSVCANSILPYRGQGPSGAAILHTLYVTGDCADRIDQTFAQVGFNKTFVDAEVKRQLSYLFGGEDGLRIPDPIQSNYTVWADGGWHFPRAGHNVSLAAVEAWAVDPLATRTGSSSALPSLSLVGEAYARRRTWCEGALQTVDNVFDATRQAISAHQLSRRHPHTIRLAPDALPTWLIHSPSFPRY